MTSLILPHFCQTASGFQIHKPVEFVQRIMPRFFHGMSHFASFQSQLSLYTFSRIQAGPFAGAYAHPLFVRSRPLLCTCMILIFLILMKRQNTKSTDANAGGPDSKERKNVGGG